MEIVDIFDDRWSVVILFFSTWRNGVSILPDESYKSNDQTNHKTPESTLETDLDDILDQNKVNNFITVISLN